MTRSRRLPAYLEPVAGESFTSFADRLAADLQVPLSTLLVASGVMNPGEGWLRSYGVKMQLERAQAFAFATGLSEARVSNMLLTHYAGISFATSEHAAGRHVDSRWEWRFCPGSHLCPECLVENGGAWFL